MIWKATPKKPDQDALPRDPTLPENAPPPADGRTENTREGRAPEPSRSPGSGVSASERRYPGPLPVNDFETVHEVKIPALRRAQSASSAGNAGERDGSGAPPSTAGSLGAAQAQKPASAAPGFGAQAKAGGPGSGNGGSSPGGSENGAPPRTAGSPGADAGGHPKRDDKGESSAATKSPGGPGNGGTGGAGGSGPFSHAAPEGHAKKVSEVLGEITWLMSQSALHKQFFISDLEWPAAQAAKGSS